MLIHPFVDYRLYSLQLKRHRSTTSNEQDRLKKTRYLSNLKKKKKSES